MYQGDVVFELMKRYICNNSKRGYLYCMHNEMYGYYGMEQMIEFTKAEITSLKINGKAIDIYEIIKVVLARFGVKLSAYSRKKQINGLRKMIRNM
jgi:hypothetical protein